MRKFVVPNFVQLIVPIVPYSSARGRNYELSSLVFTDGDNFLLHMKNTETRSKQKNLDANRASKTGYVYGKCVNFFQKYISRFKLNDFIGLQIVDTNGFLRAIRYIHCRINYV